MSATDFDRPTIGQIRRLHKQNRRWHQRMFKSYLDLVTEAQKVHLLSITVAQRAITQQVDVEFMQAYVALMTRTVTNLESIVHLFQIANYGSCFALTRTMMTDYDTLRYLATDPSLPAEWLELLLISREN